MSNRSSLLSELYQARLEDLKEIASAMVWRKMAR